MKQLLRTMSKMTKVAMASSLIAAVVTIVHADAPKISGFIDTTYSYDFNKPASRTTAGRSFDKRTGDFLLNSVQVNFEGTAKDGIGYYAELGFGTDASVYKAAGTGVDAGAPTSVAYNFDVQEAFLTYKCPLTSIMLKAGKFVTFEGIEVIESMNNPTISRGSLFSLAEPYTHVGVLAGYQVTPIVDLWLGVVNGWDLHVDNNSAKTMLAKVGFNFSDKFNGLMSLSRGAEKVSNALDQRTSFDTTWYVKPMADTTVALQFNAGQEDKAAVAGPNAGGLAHWYGFGIQPTMKFTDKFSLGSRYEWFSDLDGARNGSGLGLVGQSITFTPTFALSDSLTFRTEFRYDSASASVYEGSDGVFGKSTVSTVATEFIYKF